MFTETERNLPMIKKQPNTTATVTKTVNDFLHHPLQALSVTTNTKPVSNRHFIIKKDPTAFLIVPVSSAKLQEALSI
jgi:hypothetical protein